jgi:mannose-6-phosphate isomerase-like protein (cupin superfamily)
MSENELNRLLVVGPSDGEAFWVGDRKITIQAGAAATDGHYGLIVSRVSAGTSPPLHIHHGVDEGVFVMSGDVRVRCGDRDLTVGPGSFVLLPRDVPHTFLVVGDEDALMLGLLSPGGSERYFADIGEPATGPAPVSGQVDPKAVRPADERWGLSPWWAPAQGQLSLPHVQRLGLGAEACASRRLDAERETA